MRAIEATGSVSARYFYGSHWAEHIVPKSSASIDQVKATIKRVVPYPYIFSRLGQKFVFAAGVSKTKPHLYHEPNYIALPFRGPMMTTIYDLSFIHYAHTHPAERIADLTANLPKTLARAQHILTISEFVKQEIVDYLKIPPEKITVAPPGVGDEFYVRDSISTQRELAALGLTHGKYLLSVGTLEPRKNLGAAIAAYAQLDNAIRQEYPLIVVGKAGWREDTWATPQLKALMQTLEHNKQLRFLGYLTQTAIPHVYAGARAMVYVSIYEGFGMPIIEAMACGVPIVTSNVGAMREAAGGAQTHAALLVSPQDSGHISHALAQVLTNESIRAALIAGGLRQAQCTTWKNSALNTLQAYRLIANQ